MQKPWTKILLVKNVGSLEKRSNQPKYKEPKTTSPKTTAKLIHNNVYCFFITIFNNNNNIYYLYCAFSIKYSKAHHNSN